MIIKVVYNDENEELYCTFDKTRIELGEKFAYLIFQTYDGIIEKMPYHLENLPESAEYDEDEF